MSTSELIQAKTIGNLDRSQISQLLLSLYGNNSDTKNKYDWPTFQKIILASMKKVEFTGEYRVGLHLGLDIHSQLSINTLPEPLPVGG